MNLSLEINRISDDGKQTLGELSVIGHSFTCKTLELPYRDNQQNISCLPCGLYIVKKIWTPKYAWHFHIMDVPNRDLIMIHNANYARQLRGCIAVGIDHVDIDHDGNKDVTSSIKTLRSLVAIMPKEFKLLIK